MKKNKTLLSIVASIIVLIFCSTIFIGTTFSWFTDSASSNNNIIATGDLKVKASFMDGDEDPASGSWTEFNQGAMFNSDKWEPGYVEAKHIKIENVGDLAFKYKLSIAPNGEYTDLAEVIDVYYVFGATQVNRATLNGLTPVGTLKEMIEDPDGAGYGVLLPANSTPNNSFEEVGSVSATIAFKMRENVGVEYENKSIGTTFSIWLYATQYTYEEDGFGNDYDANAKYPIDWTRVDADITSAELIEMFADGKNPYFTEDVSFTFANTSIPLNEDVYIGADPNVTITFPLVCGLVGDGSLTVHSGKIVSNQEWFVGGTTSFIFEGGEHTFSGLSVTSQGTIVVNGGTLNCPGGYGGLESITFGKSGSLIVNGGTINLYQPINLNENKCVNAYVEINGGTFNFVGGDWLFKVRNILPQDREPGGVLRGSSIKITGGTFNATYQLDSDGDATAFIRNYDEPDTNKVLVSNYYNGELDYNCVVTGGTFNGCWQRSDNVRFHGGEVVENTVAGFVAEGYQIVGNSVDGYKVVKN